MLNVKQEIEKHLTMKTGVIAAVYCLYTAEVVLYVFVGCFFFFFFSLYFMFDLKKKQHLLEFFRKVLDRHSYFMN